MRIKGRGLLSGAVAATVVAVGVWMVYGAQEAQAEVVEKKRSHSTFAAHEWGTFTMVADPSGRNVPWYVAGGPVDLPKFVYPQRATNSYWMTGKMGHAAVRMETPVIYFYSDRQRVVDVDVEFPGGKVTEWYPHGGYVRTINPDGREQRGPFRWSQVALNPDADWAGPKATGDNHYFEARGVGSVPLQVKKSFHSNEEADIEHEEFIFYRGLRYAPIQSLHAAVDRDGVITMAPHGKHAPAEVIVFQNVDGEMRWKKLAVQTGFMRVDPSSWEVADRIPEVELEKTLTGIGLYGAEAEAMLNTWKRDWFEPGLRVFYLLPEALADELLPLNISPQPDSVVRAFVNRVDLLSPQDLDFVEQAVTTKSAKEAWEMVDGRFGRYAVAVLGAAHSRRERTKEEASKFYAVTSHPLMVQIQRAAAQSKKESGG